MVDHYHNSVAIKVDGERVPFRTTINDALGETTITIDSARFNVAIPETAFRATKEAFVR
jgi:outer membrane lipoprotein-sorting protein